MDTAVANNLNVMWIWAQTVGFNRAPFQTSPGVYNENIFRGLDYTLDQARQRNLKVRALALCGYLCVAGIQMTFEAPDLGVRWTSHH